jgi:hypothetical protein
MKKFRLKDEIEKKNQNSIKGQAQKIGLKKNKDQIQRKQVSDCFENLGGHV